VSVRKTSSGATAAAVNGLVQFVTLPLVLMFVDLLRSLAVPSIALASNLWLVAAVSAAMLVAACWYLRAASLLWQIPLRAYAFACLAVGVSIPIFSWRTISMGTLATCAGYIAMGAAAGWLMGDLQKTLRRPRRPPN
jgi:hypothetical protein